MLLWLCSRRLLVLLLLLLGLVHVLAKILYLAMHLARHPDNGPQEVDYKPVEKISKQYPENNR